MYLLSSEFAVERDHLVGLFPLLVGLLVVAALVGAVWLGRRLKAREPGPVKEPQTRGGAWQTREEYGHETAPDHGPGHQEALGDGSVLEGHHDHSPELHADGRRRLPYELGPWEEEREEEEAREGEPGAGGPAGEKPGGRGGGLEGPPPERPTWDRGGSGHGTG